VSAADTRLEPAPESDKPALWELLVAYLTEHTRRVEPERTDFDASAYPYFDSYWVESEARAYWIMRGGERAGFVLVNSYSPSGLGTDRSIAEFCILPTERRGGIGVAAAVAALQAQPGQWELQVYRGNPDGMPFWPRAIAAAGATELQLIEHDDRLIYRFRIDG
jgi:predicted acetyltransferase